MARDLLQEHLDAEKAREQTNNQRVRDQAVDGGLTLIWGVLFCCYIIYTAFFF